MVVLNAISLQMFQSKMKIFPTAPPVSLAEHLQIFYKMCFICNDKRISDTSTYNEGGTVRCKVDYAKEYLVEWSNYYKCDKSSQFDETSCRFNIHCNRKSFDLFTVNIYYHKSSY